MSYLPFLNTDGGIDDAAEHTEELLDILTWLEAVERVLIGGSGDALFRASWDFVCC